MSRAETLVGCRVPNHTVTGTWFREGETLDMTPLPSPSAGRFLDPRAIRRTLPAAVAPLSTIRLTYICDLSGSMSTANDVVGVRHEAALIGAEHLAGAQRRNAQWELQVLSFDLSSPLDRAPFALDRRGLRTAAVALLAKPHGGSSNLGPALDVAESFTGRQVIVVLSDFELFDADVPAVLGRLIRSRAAEVLALVFTSTPPAQLENTRVRVAPVDPRSTSPAEIAGYVVEAANAAATASRGR